MNTKKSERRKSPRFILQQLVSISVNGNREEFLRAVGVNLSQSGILCLSEVPVEIMTRVFLMLRLSTDNWHEEVEAEGVVLHSTPSREGYLLGIHFSIVSDEVKEKILQFFHAPVL